MDWHVSDVVRQLFWNFRAAARDRLGAVQSLVRTRRRGVLLAVVATALVVTAAIVSWTVPGGDSAPAGEFIGFYCPQCRLHFQMSQRAVERLWDAGRFTTAADKRTLLFPCQGCRKLTAQRGDGPLAEEEATP